MLDLMLNFITSEADSIILIIFCLIMSAFFSCAETAITSLGTLKVKHMIDSRGKHARHLQLWLDHPGRVITTILLYNNVLNILASSVTTQVTYKYVANGAIGIATGIMTFLVLVFGEIIPKSFAKAHAERIGVLAMRFVVGVYYLGYPLVRMLGGLADNVIKLVTKSDANQSPLITEEELEFMVSEGEKAGVIEDIKKDIIEGAFEFDDTKVREIMTPRTNLTAVSDMTDVESVLELVNQTGHSRIPVYKESIDNVVGMVLAKDLLSFAFRSEKSKKDKVKDLMRDCLFAPESKSIMGVFKDLKRTKSHMAIIIDEYGGTAGIVTMEDILEEIVGEIQDEFDAEEAKVLDLGEGFYEVSGSLNIDEFLEHFKIDKSDLPDEHKDLEADTLSGLITQLVGQMPQKGQKIDVGNVKIEVLDVQNRRIELVKIEWKDDAGEVQPPSQSGSGD